MNEKRFSFIYDTTILVANIPSNTEKYSFKIYYYLFICVSLITKSYMTNINVIIKDTNHIKNLEMLNQTHWKWQNVNLSKVELISCQALGQEQELTNL